MNHFVDMDQIPFLMHDNFQQILLDHRLCVCFRRFREEKKKERKETKKKERNEKKERKIKKEKKKKKKRVIKRVPNEERKKVYM